MKKLAYFFTITLLALAISGCSEKKEEAEESDKIPNPIEDPGGYVPEMVDLNEKMQNDIQSATDKEDERLQKSLDESNIDDR